MQGFDKLWEKMQNDVSYTSLLYFTPVNSFLLILRVSFADQLTNHPLDCRRDQRPCFSVYPRAGVAGEREVDD